METRILKRITLRKSCILALIIALALAVTGPALADKPSWAGDNKGKDGKHTQKKEKLNSQHDLNDDYSQGRHNSDVNISFQFGDQQREVIRNYYTDQYRSGHCPPGLAKKNNRCMPPGQAKKWQVGRPLPHDIIFHDLSPTILVQLGPPPTGHRFVRVASDILLIAAGTGMIMDAIQDLNEY